MSVKLYQVDAFTDKPFMGNPAGVCVVDKFPKVESMQAIAMEMNLSETAFVEYGKGFFNIRYFTPTCEVPLCGHATLAAAHILYELGKVSLGDSFIFKAKEDNLAISYKNGWINMVFPVYQLESIDVRQSLDQIFTVSSREIYKSNNDWLLIRVDTEQDVLDSYPDFEAIRRYNIAELIAVTAPSLSPKYDFVVRVFCNPDCGITEDPVTGSANCILAPYWSHIFKKKYLHSKQISKRTGEMKINFMDNCVEISGQAVTVFTLSGAM